MSNVIYLDHNATTPVDPQVLEAMLPYFNENFGNAASRTHCYGQVAERAVEAARRQVADLLGGDPKGIVWTSGATEANNLAIFGVVRPRLGRPCHIITQATEHPAILDVFAELERLGVAVTILTVDRVGRVSVEDVRNALRPETALVSIMAANNELGTIQPFQDIATLCREAKVLFHTDATQAVGKIPINVSAGIDMLSLSAHKFYGPKGVGALYVRNSAPRIRLHPILFGGGHERGFRSGTLNVPGVVGLGKAAELARERCSEDSVRLAKLRDEFEARIEKSVATVHVNGRSLFRMPHVTNITFDGIEAEALMMALEGLAVSSGSACTSMKMEPSHVLRAIGLDDTSIFGSIRFSFGRGNNSTELEYIISQLTKTIYKLRELNPSWH